jgi:hypothetical protein
MRAKIVPLALVSVQLGHKRHGPVDLWAAYGERLLSCVVPHP